MLEVTVKSAAICAAAKTEPGVFQDHARQREIALAAWAAYR